MDAAVVLPPPAHAGVCTGGEVVHVQPKPSCCAGCGVQLRISNEKAREKMQADDHRSIADYDTYIRVYRQQPGLYTDCPVCKRRTNAKGRTRADA